MSGINANEYPELEKDQPNQPYTEITRPTNMKPRYVYCEFCKYKVLTDLPWVKCGMCHKSLFTIMRDNGLARNNS